MVLFSMRLDVLVLATSGQHPEPLPKIGCASWQKQLLSKHLQTPGIPIDGEGRSPLFQGYQIDLELKLC